VHVSYERRRPYFGGCSSLLSQPVAHLASAFPLRWGYFFDERYPYVRIRPPRGARAFENADIFPPKEFGTGQTNIFVQLYFFRRHRYLVRRHG